MSDRAADKAGDLAVMLAAAVSILAAATPPEIYFLVFRVHYHAILLAALALAAASDIGSAGRANWVRVAALTAVGFTFWSLLKAPLCPHALFCRV